MTAHKLLSLTCKVLLSLLLAAILGALAVLTVVPRAVHGSALTVLTGSMTPTIPVGSVVVVQPVDPGTLKVGDVVTYQRTPGKAEFITHRIIQIHTDTKPVTLTTKGDANRGEDITPVPVTAVRGRVLFHVPYLGALRNAVSGGGLALPLAVLGLVGYAAAQLLAARRDKKAADPAEPLAAPDPHVSGPAVQLLLVTLPIGEFEGLAPPLVAELLGTELLEQAAGTFTVTTSGPPERVQRLALALDAFHPLALQLSDVVRVPACTAQSDAEVPHAMA